MAEESISRLESVLAGIRDYLTQQLSELDIELEAARGSVAELSEELASQQASVGILVASRDLLVAKLGELDGAVTDTKGDISVGALPESTSGSTRRAAVRAEAKKLKPSQRAVLGFLEATPGAHTVAQITAGVSGSQADNAAVQAVRRALKVLAAEDLAARTLQSGTAFYSATATTPLDAPAEAKAGTPADHAPQTPKAAAPRTRKSAAKRTTSPRVTSRKAATKKATSRTSRTIASAKPAAAVPVVSSARSATPQAAGAQRTRNAAAAKRAAGTASAKRAVASKPAAPTSRAAEEGASAPAEKTVRADRVKIVATLRASQDALSAAEVSRAVMGDQWKSSDATNFRNVLKSLAGQGLVAEAVGENNRARYTAVAAD